MKIWLEIDVSNERLAAILGLLGVVGSVNVTTEGPTPTSEPAKAEEPAKPEKAKKGAKAKKDEPAKPEETVKPEETKAATPGLTLEEVRARIIKACETIGTAKGLDVVEKAAGVRKAAQIDPSKFAAVVAGLDAAVAEHNEIG